MAETKQSALLSRQPQQQPLPNSHSTKPPKLLHQSYFHIGFIYQVGNPVDLAPPHHLALNLLTQKSPANCTRLTSATSTTITAIITVVSKRW